jgi:hypothetical protein
LLELIATNLAFTLLLAELALRAFAAISGQSLLLAGTLQAHQLIPGHDYGHGLVGNSLGYPGRDYPREKPAGTFRIAALGDSFAVGPAVAFADNYLTLLEKELPHTEVLNFGVSGAGPREYVQVLQKDALAFQPDLVLVSIFVGNDITETLPTPRHLAPESHALYLLCQRGWRLLVEKRRGGDFSAADRLSRPPLSPETFLEVEARRLQVCVTPVSAAMEKKWRRTFQQLDQIIAICQAHQIEVRFVLIPDEFQVNPLVCAAAVGAAKIDPQCLKLSLPQERLRAFFEAHQVACLDLLPTFQAAGDSYAPQDTHWNRHGNHLAAQEIARWLRAKF